MWCQRSKSTRATSGPCSNRTALANGSILLASDFLVWLMIRVHTSHYCVCKMLSSLSDRQLEIIIIAWHYYYRPRAFMGLYGYSGIVCTCVMTTIMIVLAAIVVNDGIIVRLSCLHFQPGPSLEVQRMGAGSCYRRLQFIVAYTGRSWEKWKPLLLICSPRLCIDGTVSDSHLRVVALLGWGNAPPHRRNFLNNYSLLWTYKLRVPHL